MMIKQILSSRAAFSAGSSVFYSHVNRTMFYIINILKTQDPALKAARDDRFVITMLLACSLLTGCSTDIKAPPAPSGRTTMAVVGAVAGGAALGPAAGLTIPVGALFGGTAGSVIGDRLDKQLTLVKELEGYGVRFFEAGDEIKMVLPADRFFATNSSVANTYSYAILRKVIVLLNKYQSIGIKVAGYTDNQGSIERNKALSTQRAQTVAHYLWLQGIDTRLLYAVGYGSSHFVADNKTVAGRAANRRIEITLEQVS